MVSAGPTYIKLAAHAGLILDDQQCEFLDEALAMDRDGYPVATQVLYIVPRQNGKDSILEALELGDLFLSDIPLIVNTTHRYQTTMEHYFRVSGLIKECPDLDDRVANYYTANGNCAISMKNGSRLKFLARAAGNARGFAGVRRLLLNEAMILRWSFMGDMGPTALTRRDRQIWLMSSPPRAGSEVLHDARRRAIEGGAEAKRLLAWIYENEPGVDPKDLDAIARVNPAFPERITIAAFEDALVEMGPEEFAIECMGVPEMPDAGSVVIGEKLWKACEDPQPFEPWAITFDVSWDRASASIVAAGPRDDGDFQVELIPASRWMSDEDTLDGVDWLIPRLLEVVRANKPRRIGLDPRVSGTMLDELLKAGFVLEAELDRKLERNEITRKSYDQTTAIHLITSGEWVRAAGGFFDAVCGPNVFHRGQKRLDSAVFGARSRPLADTWVWDRTKSEGDVTPLIAASNAHFLCVQLGERTKPKARVVNLAEAMARLEQEEKETDG